MTAPIVLDLDAIEAAAKAATPQNFDSAELKVENGHVECPQCGGQGEVELLAEYTNFDGVAIGVQFFGIGHEFGAAEAFYRAANPAAVLELVRRLRAAEALAASRIEQIPIDAKAVAVFHDVRPEQRAEAEEFAEAIKKRCTSGQWTLVAFFPIGTDIQALDKEQMRQAGWVRQPKRAEGKALVDLDALSQVLQALAGPAHHIRELQVCRGLPGSPIEKLIAEFNAQVGGA